MVRPDTPDSPPAAVAERLAHAADGHPQHRYDDDQYASSTLASNTDAERAKMIAQAEHYRYSERCTPDIVEIGGALTYNLTVTNNGPS